MAQMTAQTAIHMAGKTVEVDTHGTDHTVIPGVAEKAAHAAAPMAAHPQKKCQKD
jgi:hypothetical protein